MNQRLRGMVLLIVILVLGILAFMSITMARSAHQSKKLSHQNLNIVYANMLALSGFEYTKRIISSDLFAVTLDETIIVGDGLYVDEGDSVHVTSQDLNGKININDGIQAGYLEIPESYNSSALNPWPTSIEQEFDVSALINLRLRRILNAYGDVHRHLDTSYNGEPENITLGFITFGDGEGSGSGDGQKYAPGEVTLPTPVFTTRKEDSSDSLRGTSMSSEKNLSPENNWELYNNGLGDRIIEKRPAKGFQTIEEIRDIVNDWSNDEGINFSDDYFDGQSFFDFIKDDLTVISFEDDQFFRLDDETRIGSFKDSYLAGDGDFEPRDLQISPPNFKDMWRKHSVALINLNSASFAVRAAVFYAPTNVSYSCEGATTIPPYNGAMGGAKSFDKETGFESMIASPSIGVCGPIFDEVRKERENGYRDVGREHHFMSMYNAMYTSYTFQTAQRTTNIHNFRDFRDFLKSRSNTMYAPGKLVYEKVLGGGFLIDGGENLYFNAGNTYDIAQYDAAASQYGQFGTSYLYKTLPHILSCVRRIPSYLGAPNALQSPYMIIVPDSTRSEYFDGGLCKQPFIKVEDFVWRFMQPKVCFLPCGYNQITSTSTVNDAQGNLLTQASISGTFKTFETVYIRTQKDFKAITDPSTDDDIKIGPEFTPQVTASPYLGFVGLKDFDQDLQKDPYMKYKGGYKPQIVLNFDPTVDQGLTNSSAQPTPPIFQNHLSDNWVEKINESFPGNLASTILNAQFEGSDYSHFTDLSDQAEPDPASNLSPFGGAHFHSMNHGEFASGAFNDSLYWRLDQTNGWLNPETNPTGQDLSAGIMTFWFQLPSGYHFPSPIRIDGVDVTPDSFTHVIASLNLWEAYEYDNTNTVVERPVAITVGLKRSSVRGLCLFARYDSGGENPFNPSVPIPFLPPDEFGAGLTASEYGDQSDQYTFLGFWCDADKNLPFEEQNGNLTYENYRWASHKSTEVSVNFKNVSDNSPGSWHRATIYWNLRWSDQSDKMKSHKQLYVQLHDASNKSETDVLNYNRYHQGTMYPNRMTYTGSGAYGYSRNAPPQVGYRGLTLPFSSSMVLSLGEAHSARLNTYQIDDSDPSQKGKYYPYWRLNSVIDNIRISLGPSEDVANGVISEEFFDETTIPKYYNFTIGHSKNHKYNVYTAMRYECVADLHIIQKVALEPNEPTWVIDPKLKKGDTILSIGTHIYNPHDDIEQSLKIAGLYPYPGVYLKCFDNTSEEYSYRPNVVPKNEQNLHYYGAPVGDGFKLSLQYLGQLAYLDGDPTNANEYGKELEYYGSNIKDINNDIFQQADNFTNLPWIKEINFRYVPREGVQTIEVKPSNP